VAEKGYKGVVLIGMKAYEVLDVSSVIREGNVRR